MGNIGTLEALYYKSVFFWSVLMLCSSEILAVNLQSDKK